jgi:NAD(P)-dependent dehydrogenase (short-subunit alcohol dehydrogenase family)
MEWQNRLMTDVLHTPFGFASTADDVMAGIDLTGKRSIVTGASSGIGIETARALADAGAEVVLAVRRLDAGQQIATQITEQTGNPQVSAGELDLGDLPSVASFLATWSRPLHILVNNAGIMAVPDLQRTPKDMSSNSARTSSVTSL